MTFLNAIMMKGQTCQLWYGYTVFSALPQDLAAVSSAKKESLIETSTISYTYDPHTYEPQNSWYFDLGRQEVSGL